MGGWRRSRRSPGHAARAPSFAPSRSPAQPTPGAGIKPSSAARRLLVGSPAAGCSPAAGPGSWPVVCEGRPCSSRCLAPLHNPGVCTASDGSRTRTLGRIDGPGLAQLLSTGACVVGRTWGLAPPGISHQPWLPGTTSPAPLVPLRRSGRGRSRLRSLHSLVLAATSGAVRGLATGSRRPGAAVRRAPDPVGGRRWAAPDPAARALARRCGGAVLRRQTGCSVAHLLRPRCARIA